MLKYIGLAIFVFNIVWWKIFKSTKLIRPESVDMHSDRREVMEAESPEDTRWNKSFWTKVLGIFRRQS